MDGTMTTASIALWHKRARPNPTPANFNVQLGCHLEEIAEMLESLTFVVTDQYTGHTYDPMQGMASSLHQELAMMSSQLKRGMTTAYIDDREEFLDSIADQVVTGIGVGHCVGMDTVGAIEEVDKSNWSKFDENGEPIFDVNGKISKGPDYRKPNLSPFI